MPNANDLPAGLPTNIGRREIAYTATTVDLNGKALPRTVKVTGCPVDGGTLATLSKGGRKVLDSGTRCTVKRAWVREGMSRSVIVEVTCNRKRYLLTLGSQCA